MIDRGGVKARRYAAACGFLGLASSAGWAGACHQPDAGVTGVVVGVVTDLRPGVDFDALEVDMTLNGKLESSKTLHGADLTFPLEVRFDQLAGGDEVEARLTAKAFGAALVTRDARTTAIAGRTVLYRAALTEACAVNVAPSCPSDQTCAGGTCVPSFTNAAMLPSYTPGWAKGGVSDICKSGTAMPELTVGEGQSDYLPLSDLEVVQVEAGPQGGYHVWLAARMKGLHQSGSVTTITGSIPELGYDVAPTSVIFTFDPDEGGYCKLYGLRFRLDDDQHPVQSLLGKELDAKIEVTDSDGDVGIGTRKLMLSTDIK